jgi:hypothetical protein
MGNLLSEYRRRHNSNFIWASNDGVCFFNKNRKPAAVCLLTDANRVSTCEFCHSRQPRFVCEVLAPSERFDRNLVKILSHEHVDVDIDVAKVLVKLDEGYVPYHAKDQNDIETWLWHFFLQTRPFAKHPSFERFTKGQDKKQTNVMRSIDQMLWASVQLSSVYAVYYERLYTPFVIGRNYLLYK